MKERQFIQFEKDNEKETLHHLPPAWCGSICRNAMNEVCVEGCAIRRDCSAFEPKPDLKLSSMPRFPLKASADMTKEERFAAVTIYLSKIVDHLQGYEDEPKIYAPARNIVYDSKNNILTNTVRISDLLANEQTSDQEKSKE